MRVILLRPVTEGHDSIVGWTDLALVNRNFKDTIKDVEADIRALDAALAEKEPE